MLNDDWTFALCRALLVYLTPQATSCSFYKVLGCFWDMPSVKGESSSMKTRGCQLPALGATSVTTLTSQCSLDLSRSLLGMYEVRSGLTQHALL